MRDVGRVFFVVDTLKNHWNQMREYITGWYLVLRERGI
jgi:hypothetical protein